MKPAAIVTIATLFIGCSGSTSDRPGSFEERRERIQNDQSELPSREHAHDAPAPVQSDFDHDGDGVADADEPSADEASAKVDNTEVNERDRDPSALTPIDQSNEPSDIEITQAIRKKVVGADDLSFNAKNVKIITVAGKVTLRGPVESSEESAAIERSAREVPGVARVDNQLQVK